MVSSTYEKCGRCNGTGEVRITLGAPGFEVRSDGHVVERGTNPRDGKEWTRHEGGGYSFVGADWQESNTYSCDVCLGTGWRKHKAKRDWPTGAFHVQDERMAQLSMDEIFDELLGESPTQPTEE